MAISIRIDEALIKEALTFDNQQSERDVVEQGLREYVQRRKQIKIIDLFGTINYDEDYDYKK